MFRKAIVREPGKNFAAGLTSVDLGPPDFERALQQHEAYCKALQSCGLEIIRLAPDEEFPDSTFVEDTAVLTSRGAVVTRPGAASRLGEIEAIEPVLRRYYAEVQYIREPGTVDGGDVCEAGEHFFIGVSRRTNEEGANQLARVLESFGYSSSLIDIRGISSILHLKSGMAYLGGRNLLVIEDLIFSDEEFCKFSLNCLSSAEAYAANCLSLNGKVLVAAGFETVKEHLEHLGYETIALGMSEFQKMDGGLSCLSLRF
jgi:dimethylargininase